MTTEIHRILPNYNTQLLYKMDGYIHMNKGDIIKFDYGNYEVDRTSLDIQSNQSIETYLIFVK